MKTEVPQFSTLRIWKNRAFLRTKKTFKSHFAKQISASILFLVATFFYFPSKQRTTNTKTPKLKSTKENPYFAQIAAFSLKRHHLVQQNTLSTLRRKDARRYQSRKCGNWDFIGFLCCWSPESVKVMGPQLLVGFLGCGLLFFFCFC